MRFEKWSGLVLMGAFALALAGSACKEEGPAEEMGKAIDEAAADAEDAAEDAKKKMDEAVE